MDNVDLVGMVDNMDILDIVNSIDMVNMKKDFGYMKLLQDTLGWTR